MRAVGLDHLVLTVRSIPATVDFYGRVLGMSAITFGRGRTALVLGPHKINLHQADDTFEPKAEHPTCGSADLCLLVDSLEDVERHLLANDVPIQLERSTRAGARGPITSVYIRDPDLNLIELSVYQDTPRPRLLGGAVELLSTAEMGEADKLAARHIARTTSAMAPGFDLMLNAGAAVAVEVRKLAPPGARILVVCGPGNNGGDGFVAARHLDNQGFPVRVMLIGERDHLKGDAARAAELWERPALGFKPQLIGWADVIVDALFGAGLARPIAGDAAAVVEAINASGKPVLAVDVPSGLDGTTGTAAGPVVRATATVSFFRRKPGHLLLPGRELCRSVALYDIGIPDLVLDGIGRRTFANAEALWLPHLPRLDSDGHKYNRGHAVVVSGGIEMSGAARLCARGALRIGAGLVTVASPADALQAHAAQLNATLLKAGTEPDELRQLLKDKRYTAVGIGPGLGRGSGALKQVIAVLESAASVVLDADAITVTAADPDALFRTIAGVAVPVVLTPHEGEFKRLFPDAAGSKLERAREAARRSGATVLLKGADTVVAAPDGRAAINENAPPTLATAGSGDVLAGFVTGLLAQGMAPFEAACAAVWLHGECANRFGPGLIAEDIPDSLPRVLATLPAN